MRAPKERRPIVLRQLCAIARTVIEAEPTISDAEWKERTKVLAARQGYASPPAEMLSDALTQVERALERQWGPRPTGFSPPSPAPPPTPTQQDPAWRRVPRRSSGLVSIADLVKTLTDSSSFAPSSSASPREDDDDAHVRRQIAAWRETEGDRPRYVATAAGWQRVKGEAVTS